MKKASKKKNWLKVIVKDYNERIDKGVRFLDKKFGREKWLKVVNEQYLSLRSDSSCMLGQAYGHFWSSLYEGGISGGLSEKQACERGFLLKESMKGFEEFTHGYDGYDILTHLWHSRIVGMKIEAGIQLASV